MRSQLLAGLLVILTALLPQHSLAEEDAEKWQEIKGKHFIVHYKGEKKLAESIASRAEKYYRQIAEDLGHNRHDNFWLWENRAKIYLHENHAAYMKATGAPGWSRGRANYAMKQIDSYATSMTFLDTVLPHELTHLILRDFLGFKGEVPLWLDEGIAQWEEKGNRSIRIEHARTLAKKGKLMSVSELGNMTPQELRKSENPADFYAQAISLVGYLIEQHGSEKFGKLCRSLRSGGKLDDALRFTYPQSVRNIVALEEAWKAHVLSAPAKRKQ